jgi:conjugal transfer/type IV secretion protein DotA/TraY
MAHKGRIIKYIMLPGIIPRIFDLFKNGFFYTAYLIAVIYNNVRLIPAGHPYLNPENIGKFGLRHVVAEASNRLVFNKKNLDQIFIFFVILIGIGLLAMQLMLLMLALFASNPVLAAGIDETLSMFKNPSMYGALGPKQDIAFILLDRIFGTEGIYDSCVAIGGCTSLGGTVIASTGAYPWPFHIALHKMLAFYSSGLFVVGALIIVYFITTIVLETAESGAPFGQRVNKAWAPVRLIFFFALLIPINAGERNEGLNAAQITTFWIAKFGSNFATNAWSQFNSASINNPGNSLTNSYLTQQQSMVGRPNAPIAELDALLQFLYVARTCQFAYQMSHNSTKPLTHDNPKIIDAYIVRSTPTINFSNNAQPLPQASNAVSPNSIQFQNTPFQEALEFSSYGNITIRFGQLGETDPARPGKLKPGFEKYERMKGFVMPHCGDLTLPIGSMSEPGVQELQKAYYKLINDIWVNDQLRSYAQCTVQRTGSIGQVDMPDPDCTEIHDANFAQSLREIFGANLEDALGAAIDVQKNQGDSEMTAELIARGWGGGGIWFNKIAAMNGAVTSAAFNVPKASELPIIMDLALKSNSAQNEAITPDNQFSQNLADVVGVNVLLNLSEKEKQILIPMKNSYDFWAKSAPQESHYTAPTGNIVTDFINGIFGTSGLFDMRNNRDVHPMAQLTSLGKGMLDAVTRNALFATGLMAGKNLLGGITPLGGQMAGAMQGFFFSMVATTIAIAILLYYVLPLMPFLYFFFAVAAWVKSIFEAIVAMPLWALAHLRIDGEGLPGPGAKGGYFILFEIFLRPILILFGLLASISLFAAFVNVLNQIFDIVVTNLTGRNMELESKIMAGSEPTGMMSKLGFSTTAIDEFVYTAMYAVICYVIGTACFKLVDQIPGQILRFMGAGVSTFQEMSGDQVGQIAGQTYRGTQLINSQITGATQGDLVTILGGRK